MGWKKVDLRFLNEGDWVYLKEMKNIFIPAKVVKVGNKRVLLKSYSFGSEKYRWHHEVYTSDDIVDLERELNVVSSILRMKKLTPYKLMKFMRFKGFVMNSGNTHSNYQIFSKDGLNVAVEWVRDKFGEERAFLKSIYYIDGEVK